MARTISANETEYWLIPKRINVHQAWCLIDGIIERGYDGRSWNPSVQNNLGVNLKNWGATSTGKNISPQAIRTLTAYVQYLGFVYIDNASTPSTIKITKAGRLFWSNNKQYISKLRNLNVDDKLSLKEAEEVKFQMEKLQITNPILLKKCTNILLFPFRITLKLLRELEYLDLEELAMYVFTMKDISEYNYVIHQIKTLRSIPEKDRAKLVAAFKKTKLGNLSLVKAPSTRYYASLCESTGIISVQAEQPQVNLSKKVTTIRITEGAKAYVDDILKNKYSNAHEYDFQEDLKLWVDYYGDPDRICPPVDTVVTNTSNERLLVAVYDSPNYQVCSRILNPKEELHFAAFENDSYRITLFNISTGKYLHAINIIPSDLNYAYNIPDSICKASAPITYESIKSSIIEHIESKTFNAETLALLKAIKHDTGVDKLNDIALRGAFLESEFFKLLTILKSKGTIDDVVWHGRYGTYGLPVSAPGGKFGVCDIKFVIDDTTFVLELTTMKSKSQQEKAEATSVPDHVRIETQNTTRKVKGLFAAPVQHSRVITMMKATAASTNTDLSCIEIAKLVEMLAEKDKIKLKHDLLNLE